MSTTGVNVGVHHQRMGGLAVIVSLAALGNVTGSSTEKIAPLRYQSDEGAFIAVNFGRPNFRDLTDACGWQIACLYMTLVESEKYDILLVRVHRQLPTQDWYLNGFKLRCDGRRNCDHQLWRLCGSYVLPYLSIIIKRDTNKDTQVQIFTADIRAQDFRYYLDSSSPQSRLPLPHLCVLPQGLTMINGSTRLVCDIQVEKIYARVNPSSID